MMVKEVFNKIEEISASKAYINNNYMFSDELIKKIDNGVLKPVISHKILFLLEKKDDYNKVVFFASSYDALFEMYEYLSHAKGKYVISYITPDSKTDFLSEKLEILGFNRYKQYRRLFLLNNKINDNIALNLNEKDYCVNNDSEIMRREMDKVFDKITDDIVTDIELNQMINNKQAICFKNEEILEGFLLFENTGYNSYLRCLCVCEDFRGNGIGRLLVKKWIDILKNKTKRYNLWVNCENSPAISLYKSFGFNEDKLMDNIFVIDCV